MISCKNDKSNKVDTDQAINTNEDFEFANELINESCLYLLQHAHNPVDWKPWTDSAFEIAKKDNCLIILSIGYSTCHWSAGIFTTALHDTFRNFDFRYSVSPAVEYNIFPYMEVLRREITFAYKIGYFHNDYIEPTLYFQSQEGMFNHSLQVELRFRQPWGNLESKF
mgnify:CR=1 FL=1